MTGVQTCALPISWVMTESTAKRFQQLVLIAVVCCYDFGLFPMMALSREVVRSPAELKAKFHRRSS